MSILRVISRVWKSYEETKEQSEIPELATRYYKKGRDTLFETMNRVINQKLPNWKMTKVDSERGEIVLERKQGITFVMVVTVFKISPVLSAVDIYCSKQGYLGDFGACYKHITEFFKALHTEVQPDKK